MTTAKSMSKCSKCQGRKFVSRDGKWIRCTCLQQSKRIEQYVHARIPNTFHNLQWYKLLQQFPERSSGEGNKGISRAQSLAKRLANGERARSIILYGNRTASFASGNLILRDVIDKDISAYSLTTSELMDAEFDKDSKSVIDPAYHAEVLFLRLATEPKHTDKSRRYAVHAIEKLCLYRRTNKLFTVYSSRILPDSLDREYGKDISYLLHESPIQVKV